MHTFVNRNNEKNVSSKDLMLQKNEIISSKPFCCCCGMVVISSQAC